MSLPTRRIELECRSQGYQCIAGVDEVGMGCLAGPVVACAVILNMGQIPKGINDSKKLSASVRSRLDLEIRQTAVAVCVGMASVEEIDTVNILQAAKAAMVRAIQGLSLPPDLILIDGRGRIEINKPQIPIVKGDQKSVSIAAASIIAKVYRDKWMAEVERLYPGYGFAGHKGYGSVAHRMALQEKGRCVLHRKSFSWTPV